MKFRRCYTCATSYSSFSNLTRHGVTKKHAAKNRELVKRLRECPNEVQWKVLEFLFDFPDRSRDLGSFDRCIHRSWQRQLNHCVRLTFLPVGSKPKATCTRCGCDPEMQYDGFQIHWRDRGMCMNCLYRCHRSSNWLYHPRVPFTIAINIARDVLYLSERSADTIFPITSLALSLQLLSIIRWFFDTITTDCMRRGNDPDTVDLSESWAFLLLYQRGLNLEVQV